jgi:hypothetical protein
MDVLGHLRLAHRAVKGALDAPESERFGALLNAELALRVAMMLFDHSTTRGAVSLSDDELERVAIAIYEARVHSAIINGWRSEPEALRERFRKAARAATAARGAVSPECWYLVLGPNGHPFTTLSTREQAERYPGIHGEGWRIVEVVPRNAKGAV